MFWALGEFYDPIEGTMLAPDPGGPELHRAVADRG